MSSVAMYFARVNVNGDALAAVDRAMIELDYCGRARCDAKTILRRTGCVADLVPSCVDAEDLEVIEAAYVAALPAVHQSNPSWDDRGVWLDLGSIQEAAAGRRVPRFAAITPPELDDDEEIPF